MIEAREEWLSSGTDEEMPIIRLPKALLPEFDKLARRACSGKSPAGDETGSLETPADKPENHGKEEVLWHKWARLRSKLCDNLKPEGGMYRWGKDIHQL